MSQEEHFEFVKSLASELNRDAIKLTSFPVVVTRVRKALDHPDTTSDNLASGDSGFIVGLLNQIGVLYICTKYDQYPKLLQNSEARQDLVDEWSVPIGENIVTSCDFSEEIRATLNPDEDEAARPDNEATLVDVVIAAKASLNGGGDQVCETPATERLNLRDEIMQGIKELYQLRLDSLASAVR